MPRADNRDFEIEEKSNKTLNKRTRSADSDDEEEKKESDDTTTTRSGERSDNIMPIAINTSRPPSTASVPPAGAPRTTTTSRRGGRTRSRSPAVMGGRPPAPPDMLPPPPPNMENPSSAAAAAAAAAKAFASSGGGARSQWPSDMPDDGGAYFNEKPPSSSRHWPGEEPYMRRYQHGPPPPPPPHSSYPDVGRPSYHHHHHHRQHHPPPPPPPPPEEYADRRYRPHRYDPDPSSGRSRYSRSSYPPEYHYEREVRSSSHTSSSSRQQQHHHHHPHHQPPPPPQRVGGTTIVLGGTTPIHVPKKPPSPYEHRRESAASVFRGRPGSDGRRSGTPPSHEDENSPQQILLSLRTPTTSFEERPEKGKKTTGLSLSPDEPPQIQNSNQKRQPDQLFERSPEGSKGSIDIAPSFILFNQSFDSFGDTNYFNVDSSLQNDSFGMPRTNSIENNDGGGGTTQLLRKNSSVGNASQQLLTAGSAALTIGYSPVNSFGNASATTSRRGVGSSNSMMILGGTDARSSSPTQVLGMYRSYSGGGGGGGSGPGGGGPSGNAVRGDALEDTHMRMSGGGSFGGGGHPTSMSAYSSGGRHYGGGGSGDHHHRASSPPSNNNYYGSSSAGPMRSSDSGDRFPPFYLFLRKYRMAFKDCIFLLPGLKAALLEASLDGNDGEGREGKWDPLKSMITHPFHGAPAGRYVDPTPQDMIIARRRVESSICAFGGNINRDRSTHGSSTKDNSKDSIFRLKEEPDAQQSVTVTPSSIASPPGRKFPTRARMKYEESLSTRYYENDSRLSWEFEENPPVEVEGDYETSEHPDKQGSSQTHSEMGGDQSTDGHHDGKDKASDEELAMCKSVGEDQDSSDKESNAPGSPQPKMRYRCKLCGQPKQNHRCPYQQSLARSIGIMVYPAVNAFTAAEPGTVAAPLSEMNNFVDLKDSPSMDDNSPNRPTPDKIRRIGTGNSVVGQSTQVTPESMRSSKLHSPSPTPFTTPARPSSRSRTGSSSRHGSSSNKKRPYSHVGGSSEDPADLLFVEPMELKQEQFRNISHSKARESKEAFCYPALPLPYAQRKRLSDNLFSLSNEVPKLTDECAQVLREARERDMWDLAVAELMTQVIVIIHCPDGDHRFEGLRQYLLTLGIAC